MLITRTVSCPELESFFDRTDLPLMANENATVGRLIKAAREGQEVYPLDEKDIREINNLQARLRSILAWLDVEPITAE